MFRKPLKVWIPAIAGTAMLTLFNPSGALAAGGAGGAAAGDGVEGITRGRGRDALKASRPPKVVWRAATG